MVEAVPGDIRFEEPLYTAGAVAKLLRISEGSLYNWIRPRDDLRPVVTAFLPTRGHQARIPFVGLLEAYVVEAFRRSIERRVRAPLNYVRQAIDVISDKMGLEHALASHRLYKYGAKLLFDYGEPGGEPLLAEIISNQHVFTEVVRGALERISYDEDGWGERLYLPIVEKKIIALDPRIAFGQPVFVEGGAPLRAVLARIGAEEPIEHVAKDFGVPLQHLTAYLAATAREAAA